MFWKKRRRSVTASKAQANDAILVDVYGIAYDIRYYDLLQKGILNIEDYMKGRDFAIIARPNILESQVLYVLMNRVLSCQGPDPCV